MKKLALYNNKTGIVSSYPRADDKKVSQLDKVFEVLEIIEDEAPSYNPLTHGIRQRKIVDLEAKQWKWQWELVEMG